MYPADLQRLFNIFINLGILKKIDRFNYLGTFISSYKRNNTGVTSRIGQGKKF